MDLGINLLLALAVGAAVTVIALLIWAGVLYADEQKNGQAPKVPCQNDNPVMIPDDAPRCRQQGKDTSYYYIGLISEGLYNFVVAPFPRQPVEVCRQFCCTYENGVCVGPNYGGQTSQQNFDRCLEQITPKNCIPPQAIAMKGTTLYFPYAPTCAACDGCSSGVTPCGKVFSPPAFLELDE